MNGQTVVTFLAEGAEEALARFTGWAGEDVAEDVDDLGVCDGYHRYRVDDATWTQYVREMTRR